MCNDGNLCTWSVNNLTKPIKQMELKKKPRIDKEVDIMGKDSEDLGAICMSIEDSENNLILMGSDEGDVSKINSLVK